MSEDPFTFAMDALWAALEANSEFRSLVKESNRIKLNDGFRPFKSSLMEASAPEVQIVPNGTEVWPENPCDGATLDQRFDIIVTTGLQNTSRLFPSKWRIIQAVYTAVNKSSGSLYDLTWKGTAIIKQVTPLSIQEGLSYDEFSRELKGWATIIPFVFKLSLTNQMYGLSSS